MWEKGLGRSEGFVLWYGYSLKIASIILLDSWYHFGTGHLYRRPNDVDIYLDFYNSAGRFRFRVRDPQGRIYKE